MVKEGGVMGVNFVAQAGNGCTQADKDNRAFAHEPTHEKNRYQVKEYDGKIASDKIHIGKNSHEEVTGDENGTFGSFLQIFEYPVVNGIIHLNFCLSLERRTNEKCSNKPAIVVSL
jgi:hypothetical protein